MAIADLITEIQGLTLEEARAAGTALAQRTSTLEQEKRESVDSRRDSIPALLEQVRALRGSAGDIYDPASGRGATIRGVLAHDDPTHAAFAQNHGLALSLAFQGIDAISGALIDLLVIETSRQ